MYHSHNAYFKMWQRFARLPGNPAMRLAAHLEAGRVRRSEAALANRADLVFAAPNDGRELVDAGVDADKIRDTPEEYIAQPVIELSTCPTWCWCSSMPATRNRVPCATRWHIW